MNKFTAVAILLALSIGHAQAQSTSSAQQSSASQSSSFGSQVFNTAPADQHLSETIRNVSAPVFGAFAPNMSPLGCSSTAQAGIAVAGVTVAGGGPKTDKTCELEVAASELARQGYNDAANRAVLMTAAIELRCVISPEVYQAMIDAGYQCKRKPKELISRTDSQPESTRIASGN